VLGQQKRVEYRSCHLKFSFDILLNDEKWVLSNADEAIDRETEHDKIHHLILGFLQKALS